MSTSPLPGDASNDPTDDQSGRFVRQPNGRVRPLSPHLQVWRFHLTMLGSILNRIAAGALSVGALFVVGWLAAAAFGRGAYETYASIMGSPVGLLIWFGLSLAGAYHLTAGVRHMIWDAGSGLTPKSATSLTIVSMVAAVVIVVAFWAILFMTGKVVL
ncbi:succinate dehydrogenase / fumarate reductase cytochrome b subunit [Brevundimonas alba]|uniref:Succinate dehydrogenase cytochrome b556 subunit n=1 Tax=Brevundimonas alba TaxID=74314 RepID=A0A7X6BNN5_9CAUL|nr:succinate dehydrogenase, cytochrome b556 subunit [Brevundimonas alba]NJC40656.1 succinate dehydrogenase / fumarate reductase cytochrome b subunit [Brevundimonas alba]